MAKKFTPEQTLKLVRLYRDHPCLWDIRDDAYKNNLLRNEALRIICSDLNVDHFTVLDLKLKVKSLRSTYCQELAKIEKSLTNGSVIAYKPKLIWFEELDAYLREVTIIKRRNTGNGEDSESTIKIEISDDEHSEDERGGIDDMIPVRDILKFEEDSLDVHDVSTAPNISCQFNVGVAPHPVQNQYVNKRKMYQVDPMTNTVKLVDGEILDSGQISLKTAPKLRRIAPKPNNAIGQAHRRIAPKPTNTNEKSIKETPNKMKENFTKIAPKPPNQPSNGENVMVTAKGNENYIITQKANPNANSNYIISPIEQRCNKKQMNAAPRAQSSQDDEYNTFGKHVANQLRKLSFLNYMKAQEEIQQTLTKFRILDTYK